MIMVIYETIRSDNCSDLCLMQCIMGYYSVTRQQQQHSHLCVNIVKKTSF